MKIFRKALEEKSQLSSWQVLLLDFLMDVLIIFLIVLLLIKPFFFAPFRVKQESMLPNVLDGEYFVVWKTPYLDWLNWKDYERNDIVVFRPPNTSNYLIKRVIGLPGETLRFHEGYVWVKQGEEAEFEKLDEGFLSPDNLGNTCLNQGFCSEIQKKDPIDIVVSEDSYFVMGDNRLHSRDARTCFVASCNEAEDRFLTKSEIEGKAIFVFARIWEDRNDKKHFSLKTARFLRDPFDDEEE